MQSAQRTQDNHALAHAVELANKYKKELMVCFGITAYPGAQKAHYDFMLEGLRELCNSFEELGIRFVVREQHPVELALSFDACCIVSDEAYTRTPRKWRADLAERANCQVLIVDTNLLVPVWHVGKEEYAAYTIRPKLWAVAQQYMGEVILPKYHKSSKGINELPQFTLTVEDKATATQHGGERAAHKQLSDFISNIQRYAHRDNPSEHACSKLSAYLHFGMISPCKIVREASSAANSQNEDTVNAFIEQVFIRREVAHNFTYYNPKYDSIQGMPEWAQKTLAKHAHDKREYTYTYEQLESAQTHDELWNAAQLEMVRSGYMHNYMRMLWAKKILEWTESPQQAMDFAIKLNDTYELDGRDPNGYTGIAWSIAGKHDRAWFERATYGLVRYMSTSAAAKKFDAKKYQEYVKSLARN